jgi:tetratricopeptide (TPR) repeat protein
VFAREVDSEDAIKNVLQDAILHPVDCEKGEGVAMAEKFGIRAYPTFYAVNGKGETVSRWVGYEGAEAWAATVAGAKADPRTLDQKQAAFDAEPSAGLARTLAASAAAAVDLKTAVSYYAKAREMDPAGGGDDTQQILSLMMWGQRGGAFSFDEAETEVKPVLASDDFDAETQVQAASMLVGMARDAERLDEAVAYLKAGLAAAERLGPDAGGRAVTGLKIDHALLVEKDEAKAVDLRKGAMPDGWQDNPSRLNQFAWWCYENNINLEEALAMALRGAELAESDSDRANILDTAAEICHSMGNCGEAVAHMKRAIELDPDNGYFKDQLAKFEQALQEKKG